MQGMNKANIALIGMAGLGKSLLGRRLSEISGLDFLDIGCIIEEKAGESLQHIIDKKGEERLLKIEEEAICGLRVEDCVISPRGSAVLSPEAMGWLKEISTIIYIDVPLRVISSRIGKGTIKGHNRDEKGQSRKNIRTQKAPL